MTYATQQARQDLLEGIAESIDEMELAMAALGEAYELLDEQSADRLEETLFAPVQAALGRARRTYSAFAATYGLETRAPNPASAGLPSQGVPGFVERAREAVEEADAALADLQDSMITVEVGDADLRAGLASVRERLSAVPGAADHFMRRFGR